MPARYNWGSIDTLHAGESEYFKGTYEAPTGIVALYTQEAYTVLTFIYGGRRHTRKFLRGPLSTRSLNRAAAKFARDVSAT